RKSAQSSVFRKTRSRHACSMPGRTSKKSFSPREIEAMPSAMENDGKSPGMDDARLLVPWYAAGTLEEKQAQELENLAKEDQEFPKLIAEAKLELEAAVSVNEPLGGPSPAVWRRIETSIEQEKRAQRNAGLAERARSLRTYISGFLASLTVPQWQAVAAFTVT